MSDVSAWDIERRIFVLRGVKVMFDRDLAELYGVTTKVLNQAVKRNRERFPTDFRIRLTQAELNEVITICERLRTLKFTPSMPYAFTENGVSMLSSVLRGRRAILVNIQIMRTFTRLRNLVANQKALAATLSELESKVQSHDRDIQKLFKNLHESGLSHFPDTA